jgi:hypothetical protein
VASLQKFPVRTVYTHPVNGQVSSVVCNREVPGSNFGVDTGCYDWEFSAFLQANVAVITEARAVLSRANPRYSGLIWGRGIDDPD